MYCARGGSKRRVVVESKKHPERAGARWHAGWQGYVAGGRTRGHLEVAGRDTTIASRETENERVVDPTWAVMIFFLPSPLREWCGVWWWYNTVVSQHAVSELGPF
jgi:hypothetical protein